ncbi:MAG: ParA family protein [Candidatus Brocadiales bacterium]
MIVSVVHNKGGVGKTTTSINLSSGLALRNKKVLLVDMDPQAHSTKGVGVILEDSNLSIRDMLMKEVSSIFAQYWEGDIREVILASQREGLDVVPSELHLGDAVETLYNRCSQNFRESLLARCLDSVKRHYDYIIIDCPPGLGLLVVNAIRASQFLIIPNVMSRLSTEGIADVLEMVKRVKGNFNNYRILLTLVDPRLRMTNEYIMDELSPFKGTVLRTQITRNEAINQAQIARQDVFAFAPGSRGAEDYARVTRELLRVWEG